MGTLRLFRTYYLKREIETIMTYLYLKWIGTYLGGALFLTIGIDDVFNWILSAFGPAWAFFASLEALTVTIFWLMIADMVTGMIAAWHGKKEKIESRKMTRTVIKLFIASIVIYVPYLVTVKLGIGVNLAYFPAGVIIATELRSLLENASDILGYDVVTRVMEVFKGLINKK